jgi:MoaA/NifB/PqqE/SkfB family radical SAM enzyme
MKKIMNNYPRGLENIILTGGEPFLSGELSAIMRHIKARRVIIPTNGYDPGMILEKTRGLMTAIPYVRHVNITVSLDGPPAIHNAIRGKSDSFKNAVGTFQKLRELEGKYPNFSVSLQATVSSLNIAHLGDMASFFHNELKVPFDFQLVRSAEQSNLPGELLNDTAQAVKKSALSDNFSLMVLKRFDLIKRIYRKNLKLGIRSSRHLTARMLLSHATSLSRLKAYLISDIKRKRILHCYAGDAIGVIYPSLDVSFCEFMKPIGNLRDYGFNLRELWYSKKAAEYRRIVPGCFCTHTCFVSFGKYDVRRLRSLF